MNTFDALTSVEMPTLGPSMTPEGAYTPLELLLMKIALVVLMVVGGVGNLGVILATAG